MLLESLRQLKRKTGPRELRRFGFLVGGVLGLLGLFLGWRGLSMSPWLLVSGTVLMGLGLLRPGWLEWVYIPWMGVALALGTVMSAVLLTLLFLAVLTPMAGLARALKKDFLDLKWDRSAPSYWRRRDRPPPRRPEDYERQF
jgi:Saxitoxin biosynthesis operon protein SxtJ